MNSQKDEEQCFYSDMGFRLKQLRQIKRVSQTGLADALGVVSQTIQKYESGEIKMSPECIQRCAETFKVSVGYFYGEGRTQQKFNRISLMIASEVMMLPCIDVQKKLYALIKSMAKTSQQNNQT